MKEFIISKFGGWANASAQRIKMAADLFEQNPNRRIKINSAIGKVEGLPKVTDLLVEGSALLIDTGSFPEDLLVKIKENHYVVFEPLGVPRAVIDKTLSILESYIGQKGKLAPDFLRALLIGSGEELFSRLDAYYLEEIRGLNAAYTDPREIGHFLQGYPLNGKITSEAYQNLAALKERDHIVVYPGFFAINAQRQPMIYSRGGTDKTAADIAAATGATLYENWKDVDGVYSADPRVIKNPHLMEEVTYKEIRELSYISFNVLHQEAMLPVMNAGIPINIRNLTKPEKKGTLIVNERKVEKSKPVIGIAESVGLSFINIEKILMNDELGFVDRVFTIFREQKINIEQITTGIDSLCLVINDSEFEEKITHTGKQQEVRKKIKIDQFLNNLKSWLGADSVQIRDKKSLICVVGEGMSHTPGILKRITRALAAEEINIEVIDQGPSERNIILGINSGKDRETTRKAVFAIYYEFFPENQCPDV